MVVNLKLREDILVEKCLGRRICSQCGKNFNVACIDVKGENGLPAIYMAPLLPPNNCMSKMITRADDTEEVVRNRLRIYNDMVWFCFSIHSSYLLYHSQNIHFIIIKWWIFTSGLVGILCNLMPLYLCRFVFCGVSITWSRCFCKNYFLQPQTFCRMRCSNLYNRYL